MRMEGMDLREHTSAPRNDIDPKEAVDLESPYPRGPPLTDKSNIHAGGGVPNFGANNSPHGPLTQQDEKNLV